MKLRAVFIGILFSIIFLFVSHAQQDDFPVLKGPYLGQLPPGMTPEIFAPGIISLDGNTYRESDINFWPDGLRCIFARFGDGIQDYTIFETKEENGKWTIPEPSSLFGDNGAFEPGLSTDGKRIVFKWPKIVEGFCYIEELSSGWGTPQFIGSGIYASFTHDGSIYHTMRFDGKVYYDHIVKRHFKNGRYSSPEKVGLHILSEYEDAHPYVAPDESYLIFDSEDRPRINGCSLFVSFKQEDGLWSKPVSMGEKIPMNGALARVSHDGKYLFFKSNGDIYWVDAKIIENLRLKELKIRM